jgi:hypothetical protein
MAQIKTLERIGSKWQRVTAGAGAEYAEGVQNPSRDWAKETANANAAYKDGITRSLQNDSFAKGVAKAGTAKWQKNAVEKGPARYSQGVSLAVDDYAAGFRPYYDIIRSINLPVRGAKGDPKNINRVAVLAAALHDAKVKGVK